MAVVPSVFVHPCLRCGACCAHFRVSFYAGEAEVNSISDSLIEPVTPHLAAMRGTNQWPPRCAALAGRVGERAQCTIYEQRPSPCRELQPSYEHGEPDDRCDRARRAHGLPPLSPTDWIHPASDGPG